MQVDCSNYVWIWVAVAVYVPVAIAHKELGIRLSPYRMNQTMSVMPFEQVSLHELFTESWLPPAPNRTGRRMLVFETGLEPAAFGAAGGFRDAAKDIRAWKRLCSRSGCWIESVSGALRSYTFSGANCPERENEVVDKAVIEARLEPASRPLRRDSIIRRETISVCCT